MSVIVIKSATTEYRILVKAGDEELARQEAVKAAISAEEARLSAIKAGASEQVATQKAAQTVEDAASALASKNQAAAILANTLTGGASAGQIPFWNGPKNLIGDAGLVWDNNLKIFTIGGFARFIGASGISSGGNLSAYELSGANLTAQEGSADILSLVDIGGNLNFNTLNQRLRGFNLEITTNATSSQFVEPFRVTINTPSNAVSTLENNSLDINSGSSFMLVRGKSGSTGQRLIVSAKQTNPFSSGGVVMEDFQNTKYWAVGTTNNDYLRFFHNSNSAQPGSVNPTAWIRDNRMFIGRYGAFLPLATLHIKGEGSTLSTTSFLVENSTSQRLLTVLDNANTGINTPSPTEALDVNGRIRVRLIDNATGNFLTKSATGVLQERTRLEAATDILTSLLSYNAAIFQTLTHNASGVIAWI